MISLTKENLEVVVVVVGGHLERESCGMDLMKVEEAAVHAPVLVHTL